MSFALSQPAGNFSVPRKDGSKKYVVDNSYGAIDPVAAGFHWRRRWELDTPVIARGTGRIDSSTDYRTPGRGLGHWP